jgi:16S rRNA processing protein RimM
VAVIDPAARIVLGRINGVFGTRGWLKVYSYTRPREDILTYPTWQLYDNHAWRPFDLIDHRRQGAGIVVCLNGVRDRDDAIALVGTEIGVDRGALPKAAAGEFYWAELIGLEVFNQSGIPLGTVTGLLETAANDVLVVGGSRERLIPYVKDHTVVTVDLQRGRMIVDWHEGD